MSATHLQIPPWPQSGARPASIVWRAAAVTHGSTKHRLQEDRIAACPVYIMTEQTWQEADLAAIADVIREHMDPIVDRRRVIGNLAPAVSLQNDELHSKPEGQAFIVGALVEQLAAYRSGA
jgi:hypothetical protein